MVYWNYCVYFILGEFIEFNKFIIINNSCIKIINLSMTQ